jgi:hypothetical protein
MILLTLQPVKHTFPERMVFRLEGTMHSKSVLRAHVS